MEGSVWIPLGEGEGEDAEGGTGTSDVMERRASAATMPPMEWPIKIVRTDGSMVGDGVDDETSISITTFCNLREEKKRKSLTVKEESRGGGFIRLHIPFNKPPHTILQIPSSLKSRIGHRLDRNIRKRMADEGAQMIGETTKGVITALSVDSAKRSASQSYKRCEWKSSSELFLLGRTVL